MMRQHQCLLQVGAENAPMLGIRASPLGRYILVLLRGAPSEIWAVSRPHCSTDGPDYTRFLPRPQMAIPGAADEPRMQPRPVALLLWSPPEVLYCSVGAFSPVSHCLNQLCPLLRMSRFQGVATHEHTRLMMEPWPE